MKSIYYLTEKQKKAFNKLKSAFKDCEREAICFVNHNDKISAYDSKYVVGSTDIKESGDLPNEMCNINSFSAPINQWIDCEVYLILSEEAKKIIGN